MRTAAVLICAAAIVLIACGSDDDRVILSAADAPFVPVIESSDLAVGHSRIVLTLLDRDAQPSFASDTMFRLRLFEPTEGGTRFRMEVELEAIEIEDETYYVAREVPLDQARRLGARRHCRARRRFRPEQPASAVQRRRQADDTGDRRSGPRHDHAQRRRRSD